MIETIAQTPVQPEDIEAANSLLEDAKSTSDVSTLREMLADQNGGSVTIKAEDGSEIEVASIGREKFAELGQKAIDTAASELAQASESWHTEEK